MKTWILAAAVALASGTMGSAASLTIERFAGPTADSDFTARCGGLDNFGCEYAVFEGRAGNRATNGNGELQYFDRISDTSASAQTADGQDFAIPNPFSLTYDGAGSTTLNYLGNSVTLSGRDFGVPVAGDNPTGPARSLFIRVREANLTDLVLNSHAVDDGTLTGISAGVAYLAVAGIDFTGAWTLTGKALLGSLNNSGSAFQVKVTDLNPVPLPAAAWLLLAGLGGLGLVARRQPVAA